MYDEDPKVYLGLLRVGNGWRIKTTWLPVWLYTTAGEIIFDKICKAVNVLFIYIVDKQSSYSDMSNFEIALHMHMVTMCIIPLGYEFH